jgi:hypothetical protein
MGSATTRHAPVASKGGQSSREGGPATSAAPVAEAPSVEGLGGGRPLPPTTRQRMERAFGQSFSGVQVHEGPEAAAASRMHGAEAFTRGEHIAFGSGRYQPGSESGERLIAHELTHVVQQQGGGGGALQQKSQVSSSAEPAEQEAEAAAGRVVRGEPAGVRPGGYAPTTRERLMRRALSGAGPTAPVSLTAPGAAFTEAPLMTEAEAPQAGVETEPAHRKRRREREPGTGVPGAERRQALPEELPGAPAARELAAERERAPAEERPPEASEAREAEAERVREPGRERPPGTPAIRERGAERERAPARAEPRLAPSLREAAAERGQLPAREAQPAAPTARGAEATRGRELPPREEVRAGALAERATEAAPGVRPEATAHALAPQGPEEAQAARLEGGARGARAAMAARAGAAGGVGAGGVAGALGGAVGGMQVRGGAGGGPAAAGPAPLAAPAAAPAAASAVPSAAAGGGGGGGGGGAEAGAVESAEGAATEEQMEAAQPEEEAAAESMQEEGAEEEAEGAAGAEEEKPKAEAGDETGPPTEAEASKASGEVEAGTVALRESQTEREAREAEQAPVTEPAAASPEAGSSEDAALPPGEKQAALASLEALGGGGGEGGGGGGGGGGGAIAETPAPEVPDVSQAEPAEALGRVASLPPAQLSEALTGVGQSVNRSVGSRREELAASPPEFETPTGMPARPGGAAVRAGPASGEAARRPERAPEGQSAPVPRPEPTPEPPPASVLESRAPALAGGAQGEMSSDDAAQLGASIQALPTSDPELLTSAGPAPTLPLEGGTDPARVGEQRARVEERVAEAQAQGQAEVAQPLGEDEIAPEPAEGTLRAEIPAGGAEAAGGGEGGEVDEATSIVAQEEHGGEIQAAVQQGQGEVVAGEARHEETEAQNRQAASEEAERLNAEAAEEQRAEREGARAQADAHREQWSETQRAAVARGRSDADAREQEAHDRVQQEQEQGEARASEHLEQGEQEATRHRREGEAEAQRHKARGEQETSGGFFGWLASRAKAFFDSIKEGIKAAIAAARAAVKRALDAAKKLAMEAIERARQAALAAIRAAGDVLIAIGDTVLAAFPEARARYRRLIEQAVHAAGDAVNRIANGLKAAVKAVIDGLGAILDAALKGLLAGLMAIVDAVNAAVQGAIKAAQAAVEALGTFAQLIKDIAANPGQWLSNLGAAVVDGIRNHLWKALKAAVSEWFNQKVEEVLGLGKAIFNLLFKGGISLATIGKMAWEAIKSAIPTVLVQLLIEKLVSMIVPAAGAVMAVIEGLQAAWGTVSRILQALDRFVTFLKAVKGGGAGPQFASALAAGAVAVLDFVANWLLMRLRKPAGAVAGRLKAIAQRIMARVGKALKKVGKQLKKIWRKIKRRVGRLFRRKGRRGGRKAQRPKDKRKAAEERLKKAVAAIKPPLTSMLSKGVGKIRLNAKLMYWKYRHRLTSLQLDAGGAIVAKVNPGETVADTEAAKIGEALEPILIAAEERFLKYYESLPEGPRSPKVDDILMLRQTQKKGLLPRSNIVEWLQRAVRFFTGWRKVMVPVLSTRTGGQIEVRGSSTNLGRFYVPGLPHSSYKDMRQHGVGADWSSLGDIPPEYKTLLALESARWRGNLPAASVAEALAQSKVFQPSELVHGEGNPMGEVGTAKAGHVDTLKGPQPRDASEQKSLESARQYRRTQVARIFQRLRQAVSSKEKQKEILARPGGAQLVNLAKAFSNWLNAKMPALNPDNPSAEVNMLVSELFIFLKTFHG